jgi:hypothetical protein
MLIDNQKDFPDNSRRLERLPSWRCVMASTESLRETLEHFRQQLQRKREEVGRLEFTVNQLEVELGEYAEESNGDAKIASTLPTTPHEIRPEQNPPANGKRPDIRPDEFFGKSHGEAARLYLTRVGHAVTLDELLDGLKRGACKVGGADPKKVLYVSLLRNNGRDFVSVGGGFVGLRSFYPNLKSSPTKPPASRKPKKAVKPGVKASIRTKAVKKARVKPTGPSPMLVAIREFLADGQLRDAKDIIEAVKAKLGESIRDIGVRGVLRNSKEIEQVGDQFRLVQ